MLLQAAQAGEHDVSGWKLLIGGSALPPALCKAARDRWMDVWVGYGMSETGPVVAIAQFPPGFAPENGAEEVRLRWMTGRPVPLIDLRVVDAEMRDVPRDGQSQGEIVLRARGSTSPIRSRLVAKSSATSLYSGCWLTIDGAAQQAAYPSSSSP